MNNTSKDVEQRNEHLFRKIRVGRENNVENIRRVSRKSKNFSRPQVRYRVRYRSGSSSSEGQLSFKIKQKLFPQNKNSVPKSFIHGIFLFVSYFAKGVQTKLKYEAIQGWKICSSEKKEG